MTERTDLDRWEDEYLRTRGTFDSFTKELERLLQHLLKADEVVYAQLEARTKEVRSFRRKLERKGEKYENPLTDITDLSGLRVILYYPTDVANVGHLIEREFRVDWENSVRQGADTDPDRFGYRSDHYVVSVTDDRCKRPEWRAFADKRAEIQVRTVMQHAWAAVDHRMRYTGASFLPRDLQRRLYRLSALLEVADEQFAALQEASSDAASTYQSAIVRGELELPLDALSLSAFVDHVGDEWKARAVANGWWEVPVGIELELVEDSRPKRIEDLLAAFRELGLRTIKDVDQWLREAEPQADAVFTATREKTAEYAAEHQSDDKAGWGTLLATRDTPLLVFSHVALGDAEWVVNEHWRADISHAIIATFPLVPHPTPPESE